ncbi:hypothetical protein PsalN5692_02048 [Piscirickettsia salmonis]|uniref:hypothetical protein n=1 Tax=Piscirickettsia salmonis TaxID=1238 RepID=UPI0012B6C14D|nr:hypothetical protein [Piscirickettsia salmonis]QGP50583.1 hypothetical protein PsalN5692_02048 [Piscirickettsia salmonis]QGP54210.1 hypothetical protein PsalSR1_01642 [Piscirickettsia salmonis]QGP59891.1 hypothetical protein PsalBI1_02488 [Piscirickettsia salmonis]QGP63787.1 hypothetical protein PsalMR5_01651 [Piscirickettsia salmonis]
MAILLKVRRKKLLLGLLLFIIMITSAYAAGDVQTVTNLFTSWKGTLMHALIFIEFVSGFGGVILVVMGLFQLRSGHGAQGGGQQVQTKSGFIYMILGAALLVVGTIAGVLGNSAKSGITADVTTTLSAFTFTDTP